MYQLIVLVMQFCFAYPKSKPSIDDKQSDQMSSDPDVTKSRWREEQNEPGVPSVDNKHADGGGNVENEAKLTPTDHRRENFTSPSNNSSSLTTPSSLGSCSLPFTEVVQQNVNITVSYNPPTKSIYNSFDQLRSSSRPNCFISSIIRDSGYPSTLPGLAVKTTEIKSPEEVTGVKSPSPEAWRVAIDTGSGINWTQTKPLVTKNSTTIVNETIGEKVFFMEKNSNQLTNYGKLIDEQQSTPKDEHFDGLEAIQSVIKETLL